MVFSILPFRSVYCLSHVWSGILSKIANYYTKVELDHVNGGSKNELSQKVLLQVSVHELHIKIPKKCSTGFSISYEVKVLVCISDYNIRLIIPQKLLKMTQHHQIMYGFKTCIQAGTCQESLNNWCKLRLIFLKNNSNTFMSGSDEKFNA